MSNVIPIGLAKTGNVVDGLRNMLAAAEAGDVIGVIIAYECSGGFTDFTAHLGGGCRPDALIGAMTRACVSTSIRFMGSECVREGDAGPETS